MCKTPGKHYASRVNHQLLVVLSLLGVCVALFIANRPRMDVVALIALVAIFIPVVLLLAERQKLSPRRLMMSVKFRRVDQRHAHAGRHGAESRGRRRAATRRICGFRFFHFHAIRHGHPRGGHRLHALGPPLAESRTSLPIPLPGFARPMHRALRVAQLLGASAVLPEDAHLIATVHDEPILDCPAVTAEQCRNIAEAAMKEAFVRDVWRHRSRGGRSQGMRQLGEK